MKLRPSLYARPEIVRGQQCTACWCQPGQRFAEPPEAGSTLHARKCSNQVTGSPLGPERPPSVLRCYSRCFLADLWQMAVGKAAGMEEADAGPGLSWGFGGGAPRRNRTGDPILTIDAPVVHNTSQDLTSPHNRAGQGRCRGLRGGAGRGCAWRSFWQISGTARPATRVLTRLMLVVLIPADGFQSSG
jgi:hypothetical protein